MLRAAVIGLGDIAQIHVPLLQAMEKVELVALCDIDETKKEQFSINVPFYTDYKDMLEQEKIDVVHICLPHFLHYPVTKYCVEHHVHVLQEKPLALNAQEAKENAQVEQTATTKCCLCLQNRMNASFQECKNIIQQGTFGKLVSISGIVAWARPEEYYTLKPWRGLWKYAGGGVMINQSVHTLDLMQVLGGEISAIKGNVCNLLDYKIEVEDTASAFIEFKNGVKGFFVATNANSANDSVHLEIHLEKAVLRIQDSKLFLIKPNQNPEELIEDAMLAGPKSYYGAGHQIVFHDFYQAIEQGTNEYIHLYEGIASMNMIDAILASSKQNQIMKMEE